MKSTLPDDVAPDQLWVDPSGQHYKVLTVVGRLAPLNRATPGGRVLNTRYAVGVDIEKMQDTWKLVKG